MKALVAWVWPSVLVGQIVAGAVVFAARGASAGHTVDAYDIVATVAGGALATVGVMALLGMVKGRRSLYGDYGLVVRWRDWRWLLAGIGLSIVATGATALIDALSESTPQQEVVRAIERSSTVGQVLGAIAVVTLAPLAEELLFRGLLLRGLLRRMGAVGAVVTGVEAADDGEATAAAGAADAGVGMGSAKYPPKVCST